MSADVAATFFTIGHATRTLDELVEALRLAEVGLVADVRTMPRSRTNPQFNKETLPESLARYQIGYEHFAALGGLRGRQTSGPSPNGFWENKSFRNYADHALSESFQAALARLRELGRERRCAIMCAEMTWWRCHRRIIADYLIAAGEEVRHIIGQNRIEPARMNEAARPQADGTLLYPAAEAPVRS